MNTAETLNGHVADLSTRLTELMAEIRKLTKVHELQRERILELMAVESRHQELCREIAKHQGVHIPPVVRNMANLGLRTVQ